MKKVRLIFLLVLFCGLGWRIGWLNTRYPDPLVWTGEPGDSVRTGDYTITFSHWQWSDGNLLQELCPGFSLVLDEEGNAFPGDRERVGLITLVITKERKSDSCLDLTHITFESGPWGNQFDMELMYLLNPSLDSLRLCPEEGESREIVIPMTMLDLQFEEKEWERIDRRQFFIVLQYYPEKLQFRCGNP